MNKQYLLFILLLIFPIFISAETDKIEFFKGKNEELSGYYDEYVYFYKEDEEENIIDNAEFIYRNLDGNLSYDVAFDNYYHAYKFENSISEDNEKLLKITPSNTKDVLLNFRKMEDFTPYINVVHKKSTIYNFKNLYVDCDYNNNAFSFNNKYSTKKLVSEHKYDRCYAYIPTVMFIEETKTPKGLEKETAVLPATITFVFEFNQETEEITKISSFLDAFSKTTFEDESGHEYLHYDMNLYKYDESLDYNNIESVYNTFINYDKNMIYSKSEYCKKMIKDANPEYQKSIKNDYQIKKLTDEDDSSEHLLKIKCETPIIVDKKGSSALSVNSYVNSKEKVNLTESSNVEIKVFLKNSGKAPSYENKVVSNVPEGVEYVAGSATDNGVYDEEKNTVTWDLDYLDASSGYIFSYEVAVTTGSKESVYVTTSSVSSDDNETPIVSNEAKVTTPGVGGDAPEEESEEIVNPKTGDERSFVIILGLLIGSIVLFSIKNKKPMGI